jgi:hypothetical protein
MRTSPARSDRHALTVPPLSAGGDDASLVRGKARPGLRQNSHRDNAEIGPLAGGEQMIGCDSLSWPQGDGADSSERRNGTGCTLVE